MHYFSPGNKFQFLSYSSRFFYLAFDNKLKAIEQSDEIRHSSFIHSKPHEVKSTDMHCILTTNINKCRGEKTTRRKECQIFASAMYYTLQLQSRRISRRWTRCGTNVVIFLEALYAKTNLFWLEMKINKMYTET